MKVIKKPFPVQVEFARSTGEIQTNEGMVKHCPNDAIMTGPAGEHWPMTRSRFEATYDAIPPTRMGENGYYIKKSILVEAYKTSQGEVIHLPHAQGILVAREGDWILTASDGHQWVVSDDIFLDTYQLVEW